MKYTIFGAKVQAKRLFSEIHQLIIPAPCAASNFVGSYGNGSSDPMYGAYMFGQFSPVTVTITNLPPAPYNFYIYGHGNVNAQNGVNQISVGSKNYGTLATTTGSGWSSSQWTDLQQYVEFTNIQVGLGAVVTISVQVDGVGYAILSGLQIAAPESFAPYVTSEPLAYQDIVAGGGFSLSVGAGGPPPLSYQWYFGNS